MQFNVIVFQQAVFSLGEAFGTLNGELFKPPKDDAEGETNALILQLFHEKLREFFDAPRKYLPLKAIF